MLTAKKKITVREVQTKPRANWWDKVQDFAQTNKQIVLGGAGVILAIAVFSYVYLEGKKSDEMEASRLLRIVQPLYQQQQYKLALSGDQARGIQGLEQIVASYGSTPSGELARVYMGNCYLYTDEFDKALQAFEEAGPDGDLMKSATLAGQAAAWEGKNEFLTAAKLYEQAARKFTNDMLTADRYFHAGRMYCMSGEKEKAQEMLKKVMDANTPRYDKDTERLIAQYELEM